MSFCDRCDQWFPHYRALRQHEDDSPRHYVCRDCDIDFLTWDGLKEHYVQNPRHFYCQYCNEHFESQYELEDHYDSEHDYCKKCRRVFKNEHGLHEHLRQSENHHYCESCERDFQSENNLRNHLNSSTHRPRTFVCSSRGCGQSFIELSDLVSHFESGTCTSGVDRNTVNRYVRQFDRDNIITDPSRLLTGSDSDSDSDSPSRVEYFPTDATWNGWAYECYLCHKEFQSLPSLKQHLNSPVHDERAYFCPLDSCGQRFVTLSGLCQHIESQRCGVFRFRVVQNALDDVSGRMRLLTVR